MKFTAALVMIASVLGSMAATVPTSARAQMSGPALNDARVPSELSAPRRLRVRGTPLRVYRRALSPNAVRACDSWYALEYRPSGTVLVPRMSCRWVDG